MALTIPSGYTNAQLLLLTTDCIGRVLAGGQDVQMFGKSISMADLKALLQLKEALEATVETESAGENGGGIALARFGDAV